MLYTPHFLTGAAIYKLIPNPYVSLPLALMSHIVLDMIPHHDFDIEPGMSLKDIIEKSSKKKNILFFVMGIDFVLLVISFFWVIFTRENALWLIIAGIIAISPDLLEQSILLLGKELPSIQDKFQNRVSLKWGFISYPLVSIIALGVLLY